MNIHYDVTTGQIMSYGYGADHGDGFDLSHFEGCKVLIVDNQPIDARVQRVDPATLKIVAKEFPDPAPDPMPAVRAAVQRELADTDKFVLPDFPISEWGRSEWIAYRKALRDASKGAATAAEMLAAIPERPDGFRAFEGLGATPAAILGV
ncbi:phage tail assembly chaperone [Bradyrhizobium diazoefficiens]|uniref:phage tail assembly chaperone n=1 Tax=Bradyrhizobium diazoefficiens TaxID=1355477 RepID=UPI000BE7D0AD|nr:phage tail assembly chaperone [Bradyrhizobium diazoefficiens]PDT58727.1 hypothetical protein CO678_26205 [Bradyrhizobium diazoefficiens]QLD43831.1 hypothetical protein HUW42_23900 [Bradyrhizobium diazoefficiens]